MSEQAKSVEPAQAAAEAVKAYIRMNRSTLAADGELLALLLARPQRSRRCARFSALRHRPAGGGERRAEGRARRVARQPDRQRADGRRRAPLRARSDRCAQLSPKRSRWRLPPRRPSAPTAPPSASKAKAARRRPAPKACASFRRARPKRCSAATAWAPFCPAAANLLLGSGGGDCRSLAAFRLKIGRDAPAALFVLGALRRRRLRRRGNRGRSALRRPRARTRDPCMARSAEDLKKRMAGIARP